MSETATTRTAINPSDIQKISKAAAKIRISWLVRRDLTVTKVKSSFFAAARLIPTDVVDARLVNVLGDLYAISDGDIEPREGSFKRQAIRASARLHKLLAELENEATQ